MVDWTPGSAYRDDLFDFPYKPYVKQTERLERKRLGKNSLVEVIPYMEPNLGVWYGAGIYFGEFIYLKPGSGFLGKLRVSSHPAIFRAFLNRYGRCWNAKTPEDQVWEDKFWEIEYGLLLSAYQCYKRNPKELEDIMKVAKTKKDLKLHLGVS